MSRGINRCVPKKLYFIWKVMRQRCLNPNYYAYKWYGARGIKICEEWDSFIIFREWAFSNGYKEGLEIDRKNVNGDYSPDNCKWSTDFEQANNRRNNKKITLNNVTHTIAEWSRIKNIHPGTIRFRIRKGWNVEDAILTPINKKKSRYLTCFTIDGVTKPLYQWCIIFNKGFSNTEKWIRRGKSINEALGI